MEVAAVQFHERLGQGEAEARALAALVVGGLFEGLGKLLQVFGADAHAAVRDTHDEARRLRDAIDPHGTAFRSELDGVADEIEQDLLHGAGVGFDGLGVDGAVDEFEAVFLRAAAHDPDDLLDQVRHIDRVGVQAHLAGLDLRHVEDVVDEREQVLAGKENVVDVFPVAGIAEWAEHLLLHDVGEAVDGVQRCAQLVAHIGEELGLGLVGLLGADLFGLVGLGEFDEASLHILQRGNVVAEDLRVLAQELLAVAHVGDVGGDRHAATIACGVVAIAEVASVPQLDLGFALTTDLADLGDGGVGVIVDGAAVHALLQVAGLEAEEVLILVVPERDAVVAVPDDEGVRHGAERVEQAVLRRLHAGLGGAPVRHVVGDAEHDLVGRDAVSLAAHERASLAGQDQGDVAKLQVAGETPRHVGATDLGVEVLAGVVAEEV